MGEMRVLASPLACVLAFALFSCAHGIVEGGDLEEMSTEFLELALRSAGLFPDLPPIGSPGDMPKPIEVREMRLAAAPAPAPYLPASAADISVHECEVCGKKMKEAATALYSAEKDVFDSDFRMRVVKQLCESDDSPNCNKDMIGSAKSIIENTRKMNTDAKTLMSKSFSPIDTAKEICEAMNRCKPE